MSGRREALMLCVKKDNVGAQADLQIMEKFFKDFGFESEILIDRSVQVWLSTMSILKTTLMEHW